MVKEATGLEPTLLGAKPGAPPAPGAPAGAQSPAGAADPAPPPKASDTVAMLQQQVFKVQHQAEAMEIDGDAADRPPFSAWDPASAGSSEAERDAWAAQHQRDINCLSDPDRSTRRRAVGAISRALASGPSPALAQAALCGPLLAPLTRMLSDGVEKCREEATSLFADALATVPDPAALLPALLPVLHQRLGRSPVLEPTEEIRLSALRMVRLSVLGRCAGDALRPFAAELAGVVGRGVEDGYPECKKEAASAVGPLCRALGDEAVQAHVEGLLGALVGASQHQHSRVRQAAVDATVPLVSAAEPDDKTLSAVAAGLGPLTQDHAPGVRAAAFRALAAWLGDRGRGDATPDAARLYARHLLPLLLLGVTDESPDVAREALSLVEAAGDWYASRALAGVPDEGGELEGEGDAPGCLPEPFTGLPGAGARRMVGDMFGEIVGPATRDLREWTVALRDGGARCLHTMVAVAGPRATPHLDKVVPALSAAVGDEELSVARRSLSALRVVGAVVPSERWLGLALDQVLLPKATPEGRVAALTAAAALLLSLARAGRPLHPSGVAQLAAALLQPEARGCEAAGARLQAAEAVLAAVRAAPDQARACARDLFLVLLDASAGDASPRAAEALGELAGACGHASAEGLAAAHAPPLMDQVTARADDWAAGDPDFEAMGALLRASDEATLRALLPRVLDVSSRLLHHEKDAQMRLSLLRLLDELMEDPARGGAFRGALSGVYLMAVLLPPCVWRTGKVAAAVRYAAIVSVGTLFSRDLIAREQVLEALSIGTDPSDPKKKGALLSVLVSLLDEDYYADTRHAAMHVVRHLLRLAGDGVDHEQRRHLYPELMKRLDDPNDAIREMAGHVLRVFVEASGSRFDETNAGYLVKGILIHMDDSNAGIAEAVCGAVTAAARVWPAAVRREVTEVRDRFRSKVMCDRVVAQCDRSQAEGAGGGAERVQAVDMEAP